MRFHTENELEHFRFEGAFLAEIQQMPGYFYLILDNVIILPENSTHRDIREMRCNNLEIRIQEGQLLQLVEEGYNLYNANGDLTERVEDTMIDAAAFNETLKSLDTTESTIYSIEKNASDYIIAIDGEERTYTLTISGSGDTEDWDRYLNLESM